MRREIIFLLKDPLTIDINTEGFIERVEQNKLRSTEGYHLIEDETQE